MVGGGGTGLLTGMTPVARRMMMSTMMSTTTMITTMIFTFFHQYERATFWDVCLKFWAWRTTMKQSHFKIFSKRPRALINTPSPFLILISFYLIHIYFVYFFMGNAFIFIS